MRRRLTHRGLLALFLFAPLSLWAQKGHSSITTDTPLAEKILRLEQRQEHFRLFLNTQVAAEHEWGGREQFLFKGKQLRLDMRGRISPLLSYRWLQRLNRSNDNSHSIDNLPTSIDMAQLNVHLSPEWTVSIGRLCAVMGGIEFDYNPIVVHEFAEMLEYLPCFMSGVTAAYQVTPQHKLQFQVQNSRVDELKYAYAHISPATTLRDARLPLVYTAQWAGTFGQTLQTYWSYSYFQQTDRHAMHYIALGNELKHGPWYSYLDLMYARAGLNIAYTLPLDEQAELASATLKVSYRLTPHWLLFGKGMYEVGGATGSTWGHMQHMRTSIGGVAGVEYYPTGENLRFFVSYVGRNVHYLRPTWGDDQQRHRLSAGFIYQLPLF